MKTAGLSVIVLLFAFCVSFAHAQDIRAQDIGAHIRAQGDPEAPITLIEYASLTCPHCGAFHKDTVKKLLPDYIAAGKLLYIYRDFPLDGTALGASMLAECVGRDGNHKNYFKFLDVLYEQQRQWLAAQDIKNALIKLASFTGLSAQQAEQCLQDKNIYDAILAERKQGEKQGVNATPSIFINGERQTDTSYGAIKKRIEELLS